MYELKYSELAVEYREGGWTATIHLVEVGFRGLVGKSTILLLRAAGIMGTSLKSIKELAEDSKKTGYWLWLRRRGRVLIQNEGSCRGCRCPLPPLIWGRNMNCGTN